MLANFLGVNWGGVYQREGERHKERVKEGKYGGSSYIHV
jgi:hypothetical protein